MQLYRADGAPVFNGDLGPDLGWIGRVRAAKASAGIVEIVIDDAPGRNRLVCVSIDGTQDLGPVEQSRPGHNGSDPVAKHYRKPEMDPVA